MTTSVSITDPDLATPAATRGFGWPVATLVRVPAHKPGDGS